MVPRSALAEEAHGAAVNEVGRVKVRLAPDLALEAMLGKIAGEGDAGLGIAQRGGDLGGIIADGRDDTKACDNYPSHEMDLFKS